MKKIQLSIPFSVPLTKEKNWNSIDNTKTKFFVARFHFSINIRQASRNTSVGEIQSVIQSQIGASTSRITSVELETEEINHEESFHSSIVSNEFITEILNNISSEIGQKDIFKIGSESKLNITNKFKFEFIDSFKLTKIVRNKKTEKLEIKYSIDGATDEKFVAASVYKRIAWDVSLSHIDYLIVKYEKKYFGLRRKRKHQPNYENGKPQNIIRINLPICCIKFWERLDSSILIKEKDYIQEVDDSGEIEITEPEKQSKSYIEQFKKTPSLYQIAFAAFPLKWKNRKGDWTEEELIAIEFDDAINSAWWFKHGPGRK
ncbi:MAG: hypothetical protein CVU43_17190 [Chloroflexi bacterium HGW-Chloroflexi-5]|jgi:hypothetical protein|nr:MAG: hypothetical protein CVU43_17190 [Chloroflexi bacterium HGW-Chloroflexi-5]PKP05053.1 MAG: hypothetical protein CVU11_02605 [Bacteroidetes bacterium HGW-Bacteroidetes-6]